MNPDQEMKQPPTLTDKQIIARLLKAGCDPSSLALFTPEDLERWRDIYFSHDLAQLKGGK